MKVKVERALTRGSSSGKLQRLSKPPLMALELDAGQQKRLRIAHYVFGAILALTFVVTGSLVSNQFEATLPILQEIAHNIHKAPNATVVKEVVAPHVILVVADDLGHNDVGFNSRDMASCTPTLDMMRAEGIELGTLYAAPSCTASRAALLTAFYPSNIGMQHADLKPAQPWSLAPGVRTLAQNLRDEGFWTALVGKWHLGHYMRQATPTYRGFDEFFGFYGDSRDYYSRISLDISCDVNKAAHEPYCFWDAVNGDAHADLSSRSEKGGRDGEVLGGDGQMRHSTYSLAEVAVRLTKEHSMKRESSPLFLMLSLPNSHGPPLQAPEAIFKTHDATLSRIVNDDRRAFAALTILWDEALHNVSEAIESHLTERPTLYIILSDNGAAPRNGGSNWPLRGAKHSAYDGGTRVFGVVYSTSDSLLARARRGSRYDGLVHVVDIPTTILGYCEVHNRDWKDGIDHALKRANGIDHSAALRDNGTLASSKEHRTEEPLLSYTSLLRGAAAYLPLEQEQASTSPDPVIAPGLWNAWPRTEALISLDYLDEDLDYLGYLTGALVFLDTKKNTMWKMLLNVPRVDYFSVPTTKVVSFLLPEGKKGPPRPLINALYNLTADPREEHDLSAQFREVYEHLAKRLKEHYFLRMQRANILDDDPKAYEVWTNGARFVGPWRTDPLSDAELCEIAKPARVKFEAANGLLNCSLSNHLEEEHAGHPHQHHSGGSTTYSNADNPSSVEIDDEAGSQE